MSRQLITDAIKRLKAIYAIVDGVQPAGGRVSKPIRIPKSNIRHRIMSQQQHLPMTIKEHNDELNKKAKELQKQGILKTGEDKTDWKYEQVEHMIETGEITERMGKTMLKQYETGMKNIKYLRGEY